MIAQTYGQRRQGYLLCRANRHQAGESPTGRMTLEGANMADWELEVDMVALSAAVLREVALGTR